MRIHIRTDTQLLTVGVSRFMSGVHGTIGGVEVDGIVSSHALAVNLLCIIVVRSHFQQALQHGSCRNEFGVGTIHESNTAHIVERNGLELLK